MSGKRRQRRKEGDDSGGKKGRAEVRARLGELADREEAARAWRSQCTLQCGSVILDSVPFQHCVIHSFIENTEFLEGLKEELLVLNFQDKSNDLYKFQQSEDLKSRNEPYISALRKVLFEDFRQWLSEVTHVELETTVDISCAQYNYTDVLLCHDDELEGRRFAFILYLVPEWTETDGGSLDLYSTDDEGQPSQIVKSILPSWNTLIFFEVSPVSFHQVAEVLSEDKCRLSVSGWFHGSSLERPARSFVPMPVLSSHIPYDDEILCEWLNPDYLSVEYQAQIQEEFEDASEILLKDFFKEDKFQAISAALKSQNIEWEQLGPPNRRSLKLLVSAEGAKAFVYSGGHVFLPWDGALISQWCYNRAKGDLPEALTSCMELLKSEAFFLLLSNLTGLKLHFLAASNEDSDDGEGSSEHNALASENGGVCSDSTAQTEGEKVPVCYGELRHWEHGHYTLIHDHDPEWQKFALDLFWFCGCEEWEAEYGGFTSYIASGENEELLTVYPENNCLALVYRDKETMRFVKHINHKSLQRPSSVPNHKGFWDFTCVYYE